jgi:hypothetical protein
MPFEAELAGVLENDLAVAFARASIFAVPARRERPEPAIGGDNQIFNNVRAKIMLDAARAVRRN